MVVPVPQGAEQPKQSHQTNTRSVLITHTNRPSPSLATGLHARGAWAQAGNADIQRLRSPFPRFPHQPPLVLKSQCPCVTIRACALVWVLGGRELAREAASRLSSYWSIFESTARRLIRLQLWNALAAAARVRHWSPIGSAPSCNNTPPTLRAALPPNSPKLVHTLAPLPASPRSRCSTPLGEFTPQDVYQCSVRAGAAPRVVWQALKGQLSLVQKKVCKLQHCRAHSSGSCSAATSHSARDSGAATWKEWLRTQPLMAPLPPDRRVTRSRPPWTAPRVSGSEPRARCHPQRAWEPLRPRPLGFRHDASICRRSTLRSTARAAAPGQT